jgi:hypothetical protein
MAELSKLMLWMIMLGMLLSGTANTIVVKAMDVIEVNGSTFAHPYF